MDWLIYHLTKDVIIYTTGAVPNVRYLGLFEKKMRILFVLRLHK